MKESRECTKEKYFKNPMVNQEIEQLVLDEYNGGIGDHQSYIAEKNNSSDKYLVKTRINKFSGQIDQNYEIYFEILAARFYQFFSSESLMAETGLFLSASGDNYVSSKWINEFIPYLETGLPIIENGDLLINYQSMRYEVTGFISMLLVSRLIGNYDAVGKGSNAGFLIEENQSIGKLEARNVKIDPGGSFAYSSNNKENVISGIAYAFAQKLSQKYSSPSLPDYDTSIPLDIIDQNNVKTLISNIRQLKTFIDYYHPSFDTRDLLLEKITYAELIKSQKLYNQLAFAVEKIVAASGQELLELIDNDMPSVINGEDLSAVKEDLFEQIKLRQLKISQLYHLELKYIMLYRVFGNSFDFDQLKFLANYLESEYPTIFQLPNLVSKNTLRDLEGHTINIIDTVMTAFSQPIIEESYLFFPSIESLTYAKEKQNFDIIYAILKNFPEIIMDSDLSYLLDEEQSNADVIEDAIILPAESNLTYIQNMVGEQYIYEIGDILQNNKILQFVADILSNLESLLTIPFTVEELLFDFIMDSHADVLTIHSAALTTQNQIQFSNCFEYITEYLENIYSDLHSMITIEFIKLDDLINFVRGDACSQHIVFARYNPQDNDDFHSDIGSTYSNNSIVFGDYEDAVVINLGSLKSTNSSI